MANTYTQLYVHIVFSVKGRHALIPKQHKSELHKYITGIISNKKQKLIQINSMPDSYPYFDWDDPGCRVVWFSERHQGKLRRALSIRSVGQWDNFRGKQVTERSVIHILRFLRWLHILKIKKVIIQAKRSEMNILRF